MIEIIEVSPNNEEPVAKRLAVSVRAAWPEVANSSADRVTIAVGLQTLRDIDLLVTIELSEPHTLSSRLRRDGSRSPEASIQAAAIIIEVKQLDEARFTVVGTHVFPDYGKPSSRSVNAQVDDCRIALRNHSARYGVADFFVHGVGWLTAVSPSKLAGVSPWIVGADAGWLDILDAAAQQSPALYGPKAPSYLRAIATIRETLTSKRAITPRDRKKSNDLSHDVIVDELIEELAAVVGRKQIRLTGRGGSGKTTTLALLAKRLASVNGERVLILTFHKTLRSDIEHLIDVPGVKARNIGVKTATTFFVSVLTELGVALPQLDGALDFKSLAAVMAQTLRGLSGDSVEGEAALLKACAPERFAWDYVFIDEAQDWTDAERDFIRALYGSENLVLADGLKQLVRRQTPCDWNAGLLKSLRYNRNLSRSLRMATNLASFANAFARETGPTGWRIEPFEKLPGGRIIIALGGEPPAPQLFDALLPTLAAAGAAPVDALVCVPPQMVESQSDGTRQFICAPALLRGGFSLWDACDDRVRDTVPSEPGQWRIVRYDSCRGLEGWVTVAYGLDQLAITKHKHPNLASGETDTPENVVRRWLMIALTRAVNTLIITVADPAAPIVRPLRVAAAQLPSGVVEWTTGADCAGVFRPPA
jgi:hypothetical protein